MVQSINQSIIIKANLGDLCQIIHHLATQFPSHEQNTLVQIALERLNEYSHINLDQVCSNVPLDLIIRFLDCDDELVLEAACSLLNTWIKPWSSSSLLDRMEMITLGLNHQAANVRILLLSNLSKLSPQDWSSELAVAALNSVLHESVSVFAAFTSLLTSNEYIHAILMPIRSQAIIQSALLPHRVYVFRGLELIGRAARLLPNIHEFMPNASTLFHDTFVNRITGSDVDYAVFCTLFQSLLSPSNMPIPGEPQQVMEMASGQVIDHLIQQTETNYYPECGIEPLLAIAQLLFDASSDTEQEVERKILSVASKLVEDGTTLCAYTVVRTLSSYCSAAMILSNDTLVSALRSTFKQVMHSGPQVLVNGTMQFMTGMASYSQELIHHVMPRCGPESDHVQSWVTYAIRFAQHTDHRVFTIGFDALLTIASLEWSVHALLRPDRISFILHLDDSVELRQAKCAIAKRILMHEFNNPGLLQTLTEFVRRGPFAMPANAQALVEKVSM